RQAMELLLLPAGLPATVSELKRFEGEGVQAVAGENVGVVLDVPGVVTRGGVLCPRESPPKLATDFTATLFWISDNALSTGDNVLLRCSSQEARCKVTRIIIDETESPSLDTNEFGEVSFCSERPYVLDGEQGAAELRRFVIEENGVATGVGVVS